MSLRCISVSLAVAAACSRPHDVTVAYAARSSTGAGSVDVLLNSPSRALSITVNDALVVDRKYSRKARIEGLPLGIARVHIATGGKCEHAAEYDREVEIIPGATASLVFPGPEPNHGCMVQLALTYVGWNIGMVAMAITLAATPHVMGGK